MLLFGRMHTEAFVFGLNGCTAEQRLVYAVSECRYASVLAISNIGQVERAAEVGCERPEFGVSFDTGTEHRAIRATNLVAIL